MHFKNNNIKLLFGKKKNRKQKLTQAINVILCVLLGITTQY